MIEITRDNIEEVCQKLNDMEYDDVTDKEICDWFIQLKRDFCADFNKFYDENYEHDEISFEYFGCIDDYNEVKEIVEVTIEGNKLKILNSHMFMGSELTNTIKIPLDYAALEKGFKFIIEIFKMHKMPLTVHMPKIGCGLAGGDWNRVEEIIKNTFINSNIEVYVYLL